MIFGWDASDYEGSRSREQWERGQASTTNLGFDAMSGRAPQILQYASDATIGGQHACDANVFRGSPDDFDAMITLLP